MAFILNIETATTNCSVSVSENGKTIALKEDSRNGYSHAEKLHVFIDEVIAEANINTSDLDAIAVSKGPGSYTGLRIGVSAAKGLAFALNKPLISVPTLDVLAHQIKEPEGIVIAMLDARRMEVYSAVYDDNFNQIRNTQAQILEASSFEAYLNKGVVYFVGDGVTKTKELISNANAVFIEDKLPSANNMSALAFHKFELNNFEDVAYFEPYYLKDFVAIKPKS